MTDSDNREMYCPSFDEVCVEAMRQMRAASASGVDEFAECESQRYSVNELIKLPVSNPVADEDCGIEEGEDGNE